VRILGIFFLRLWNLPLSNASFSLVFQRYFCISLIKIEHRNRLYNPFSYLRSQIIADPIDQCYLYFGLRGRSMGPNYKQLKDKEHTFSLTTRYLIGAARSSLKISLMLNMMLFFMRPGSGSCHRWKKEIWTGPKATREKVSALHFTPWLCFYCYAINRIHTRYFNNTYGERNASKDNQFQP